MNNKQNKPVSYRLPEKIKTLITILSEKFLVPKTTIIILAILDFSEKHNIKIEEEK